MLIRRINWPVFFAIAVLGPVVGALVALQFTGLDCADLKPSAQAPPAEQSTAKTDPTPGRFVLPDGDHLALDEIAPDRAVAIVVMKAPGCPVCQRQLKRLSNRLDDVQAAGGTVVGMTTAEAAENRKLANQLELGFPILGAQNKEFHRRLGLWRKGACHAIPGVVFLDESGSIAKVHRGRYPGRPQDAFVIDTLESLAN